MFKIFRYLQRKEWLQVGLVFLFAVLQVRLDLMIPSYFRRITMLAQMPDSLTSEIVTIGAFMLLCALGSLACVIAISFLASRVSAALSMRLRDMLFDKVADFSMEEFARFSTSSLIARSTNDITQIQQFAMSAMQMLLKVPILAVGGMIGIAGSGIEWTIAALIAFVFMLIVVACTMAVVMPQFKKMQKLVDRLNLTVRESLAGRYVIRAFNAEAYHEEKFEAANSGFTDTDRKTNRTMAVMSPVMSLGSNGVIIAVYIIGALMINAAGQAESLTVFSNMIVMTFYLRLLFDAIKFITKVVPRIPRAIVSAGRIIEVLNTEPMIKEGNLAEGLPNVRGEIAFRNVGFKYPGAAASALEGITFTAKQGETVAFIGSTGSGKTTLINLVMRFFDANEGEILINGVDIKAYKTEALNDKLGYVPQKSVLFKGTVSSNVAYGDNGKGGYSPADIEKAIQIARAEEFVSQLEGGVNAAVSQRGVNFSGGQKQRLSIARAVCRTPEILIFDDSFSALDYKTDREVRQSLSTETDGATRLIVAQRIGTIIDADQIIVLDDGNIAGIGTHKELLESCQVYREIAKSQLSEEELAS
ncbi:MAG: ABC transporter ATP-binding protein/permease [Oscillospiraceae bacterium]|nr:ABC transporter ATP-binding protein/permease [Oscillospiraceae bacterium]